MTITVRLSDLPKVRQYLDAISANSVDLKSQHDQALARYQEWQAAFEPINSAYQSAHTAFATTVRANQEELGKVEMGPLINACESIATKLSPRNYSDRDGFAKSDDHRASWTFSDWVKYARSSLLKMAPVIDWQGNSLDYSKEAVDIATHYNRVRSKLEDLVAPDKAEWSSAKQGFDAASRDLLAARKVLTDAEERLNKAKDALPQGAELVSINTWETILGVNPEDWPVEEAENLSLATKAGIIRSEITYECVCNAGYIYLAWGQQDPVVALLLDDRVRHPLCAARAAFRGAANPLSFDGAAEPTRNLFHGAVEEDLAYHRVHSLQPWVRSPVPPQAQQEAIDRLRSVKALRYGKFWRGWLLAGPPGASKSTYASAVVTDLMTIRMADMGRWSNRSSYYSNDEEDSFGWLNYWRVEVPRWVREQEAWENRDFEDRTMLEPSPMPKHIEEATSSSRVRPILLLEEIDKFSVTKNRLRNLYNLVATVYKLQGTIITTTNLPLRELEQLVGEPIYRRLSGTNDAIEDFQVWDLWKLAKKGKRTKKT